MNSFLVSPSNLFTLLLLFRAPPFHPVSLLSVSSLK
jgi:hypothetical protein